MVFFRSDNKQLNADRVDRVTVDSPEKCLGICLHNRRCRSFNAGGTICELLGQDRCSVNATLLESVGTSYFDTVPDGKCLKGKRC